MPTPGGPTGPDQFTGFLLRRAFVASRERAQACVSDDSSVREVPVLTLLGEIGAMSQRRLGELMNLDRTTIGKVVDALETKGWLVRERDAHDRRSYALRLTSEGRAALTGLQHSLDRGEADLISQLTPAEQGRLTTELRQLLAGDATLGIEGLGNRCGYLIARAHRAMFHRAAEALEPLGLTPRDFGVLTALALAQPCSQQRLAAILGVSAPAVLGFVDELEAAGLVVRRRNIADRRAYDVTLTPAGASKLDAARAVALDLQATIARALGAAVDQDLRDLLSKVIGTSGRSSSDRAELGARVISSAGREECAEPSPYTSRKT